MWYALRMTYDTIVPRCIRVSYKHVLVRALCDEYMDNTTPGDQRVPFTSNGWTFDPKAPEDVINEGDALAGVSLTKPRLFGWLQPFKVTFVVCEGDDNVYFIGEEKALACFKRDWKLTNQIRHNHTIEHLV